MNLQRNEIMSETQADQHEAEERDWRSYLVRSEVPEHLHEGFVMYLMHRVRPGSFLTAVLENDLNQAVANADPTSGRMLREVVGFLRGWAPHNAWGSAEIVEAWVKRTEVAS